LLADALKATGQAGRPEEYFWDEFYDSYLAQWGWPRINSYGDFLECALRAGTTDNGVFAAKLHWNELEQLCASLRSLTKDAGLTHRQLIEHFFPSPRFVYLRREDRVRQAISWFRAFHTAKWFKVRGDEAGRCPDPLPDWCEIHAMEKTLLDAELAWQSFFAGAREAPLEVLYEDLVYDYESTIRTVLRCLAVPDADQLAIGAPRLVKQGDELTEEWVRAYLEVRRARWPPPDQLYGQLVDSWHAENGASIRIE
jgi:LPS sulfotransferase NodH